jgi:methionine synthase I (cobalamin-dependent)
MSRFVDALNSGQVLLMDGAMGTELERVGVRPEDCYELCNLTHPEWVGGIHQAYVNAGARCLLTNTFQANPAALGRHRLDDKLEEINAAGVTLARSVAGPERFVLGSVGPFQPCDVPSMARLAQSLTGVDALLLETWSDMEALARLLQAHEHLWNPEDVPLLVSFTYRRSPAPGAPPFIPGGVLAEQAAASAERFGAAAVGVNCGRDIGMDEMIAIVQGYRRATRLPLLARPNAGTPRRTDHGWTYPRTPDAMAARLPELIAAGVTLIGGCCGTTPGHVAAFRHVLASL